MKIIVSKNEGVIYKLAKKKEMKTRGLNGLWCIKDEDQRVLVKEEHNNKKWKSYFDKLFNGNDMKDWSDLDNPMKDGNHIFVRRIRMAEVKDALRRMKMGKPVGPDKIPIDDA